MYDGTPQERRRQRNRKRRTNREIEQHRKTYLSVLIILFIMFAAWIATAVTACYFSEETSEPAYRKITHDSLTITYDYKGEETRYYVMIDPDTQVQYLVNDKGGMCVREFPDVSEE